MTPQELETAIVPIAKELQEMQDFLDTSVDADVPEVLLERLTKINVYLSRSSKLLADVKFIQDKMEAEVYNSYPEAIERMPATIARNFVKAQTANINHYVNWADRINSTLVHVGDNIRTQISYAKESLRLTKSGY